MNIPEEFENRIRLMPNGCWNWLGNVTSPANRNGNMPYGIITRNGKQERAHRFLYTLLVGGDIEGKHLHHKCFNPLCVNPEHLEVLTQSEHNQAHGKFKERAESARSSETCRNGHLWSENTYMWKDTRICKACQADAQRKMRAAKGGPGQGSNMREKTHCPQGHPYAGENLYIDGNGGRNCKICLRANSIERKRRYRERLKERAKNPTAN